MSAGHINVFVIGSRMESVIFLLLFKPFQSNLQNMFFTTMMTGIDHFWPTLRRRKYYKLRIVESFTAYFHV